MKGFSSPSPSPSASASPRNPISPQYSGSSSIVRRNALIDWKTQYSSLLSSVNSYCNTILCMTYERDESYWNPNILFLDPNLPARHSRLLQEKAEGLREKIQTVFNNLASIVGRFAGLQSTSSNYDLNVDDDDDDEEECDNDNDNDNVPYYAQKYFIAKQIVHKLTREIPIYPNVPMYVDGDFIEKLISPLFLPRQ